MGDFIDLVESSRWVIDRFLSGQESDDFANLETGVSMGDMTLSQQQQTEMQPNASTNDNILNAFVNEDTTSYTATSTSPFLSKSAEAELYLLGKSMNE